MTQQAEPTITFRVHASNGGFMDVDTTTPDKAREAFKAQYPTMQIMKVKRVKEERA